MSFLSGVQSSIESVSNYLANAVSGANSANAEAQSVVEDTSVTNALAGEVNNENAGLDTFNSTSAQAKSTAQEADANKEQGEANKASAQERIASADAKIATASADISTWQTTISELQAQQAAQEAAISAADAEGAQDITRQDFSAQIAEAQNQLKAAEQAKKEAEAEKAQAEAELTQAEADIQEAEATGEGAQGDAQSSADDGNATAQEAETTQQNAEQAIQEAEAEKAQAEAQQAQEQAPAQTAEAPVAPVQTTEPEPVAQAPAQEVAPAPEVVEPQIPEATEEVGTQIMPEANQGLSDMTETSTEEVQQRIENNEETDAEMADVIVNEMFKGETLEIAADEIIGMAAHDAVELASESFKTQLFSQTVYTTKVSTNTDTTTVEENQEAISEFMESYSLASDKVNAPNVEFLSLTDKSNYDAATRVQERLNDGEYILTREIEKSTTAVKSIQVSTDEKVSQEEETSKLKGEDLLRQLENVITTDESAKEDQYDDVLTQNEYDEMENFFKSTNDVTSYYKQMIEEAKKYGIYADMNSKVA